MSLSKKSNPNIGTRSIGVFALIEDEDKVLLVRQRGKRYWCLPGGKITKNETLLEGLKREVLEETRLRIKIKANTRIVSLEAKQYLTITFSATLVSKSAPVPSNEIEAAQYFPLNKLPKLLTYRTKLFLKHPTGSYCEI